MNKENLSGKDNYTEHARKQVNENNRWYVASQFAWAKKESIRRIYEQRFLFFYKIIKRKLDKKERVSLLDYGCGDGYWSLIFSQFLGCKVTGVDYNPLRLERARLEVKNAQFLEADLRQTSGLPEKFNIVFCNQIIEHIDDDESFLAHITNVMANDGVLILGTTNEGCFTQRLRRYFNKEKTDHVHFYKEKEIINKIAKAGFIIKDTYREVFYPGSDRLYYKMTLTNLGFKLLELLTILFPSQCSDYYFECTLP